MQYTVILFICSPIFIRILLSLGNRSGEGNKYNSLLIHLQTLKSANIPLEDTRVPCVSIVVIENVLNVTYLLSLCNRTILLEVLSAVLMRYCGAVWTHWFFFKLIY